MLLAFLTAGYVLRAETQRMNEDPDKAWDFVFMAVIGGILGSEVVLSSSEFPQSDRRPNKVFSRGGLVWYGGFLLATALVIRGDPSPGTLRAADG